MGKKRLIAIAMSLCMLFSVATPQAVWGGTQAKAAEGEAKATGSVIDATKYGADPTGLKDSAEAIIAAIAAAKAKQEETNQPVTIDFPKGEYQIYPDKIEARELYITNTVGTGQGDKMKKIGFLFEEKKSGLYILFRLMSSFL